MERYCEHTHGSGTALGTKNILCTCTISLGWIFILFCCHGGRNYVFIKKDDHWDDVGLAAAELGTVFMALVLITGPIWATPIWGKPWIWEPRLTTTLILFLIYIGYFMMRSFGGHVERVKRYAAALGIIAFVDVPIIFVSVKFWTPEIQSHPQVEMAQQPSGILTPFLLSLGIFTLLYTLMLTYKIHVIRTKNNLGSNV